GCVGLRGGSRAALATLHDGRIMWVDQRGSATDLGSHSDAVGFGDAIALIDGQRVEFVAAPPAL
ncbi:MAG: hypothetical protein KDB16_17870, partial [Acidimicrobiales bacterium]|nr:hypothetical protein [Acidimicrobiales bacterium]